MNGSSWREGSPRCAHRGERHIMRSPSILLVLTVGFLGQACDRPASSASPQAASGTRPRLVILGFDGVDPRHVEALVQAGKLPHIARLGAQGSRGSLATTNPPQSPVAWAAFATGLPPGEHG